MEVEKLGLYGLCGLYGLYGQRERELSTQPTLRGGRFRFTFLSGFVGPAASVELQRFSARLYDRVPGALWRVD